MPKSRVTAPNVVGNAGRFMMDICQPCVAQRSAMFGLINFGYSQLIVYPQLLAPLVVTPHPSSLDVMVNMSDPGVVWCAAVATGQVGVLKSTAPIKQTGTITPVLDASLLTTLTIRGLFPATTYDVYCYTESFEGQAMPLPAVVATKTTAATACCKSVNFTYVQFPIPQLATPTASVGPATPPVLNMFTLNAFPTSLLYVNLTLTSLNQQASCKYNTSRQTKFIIPQAFAMPNFFTFRPVRAQRLAMTFVVSGDPGCYLLTAIPSTKEYYGSSVSVAIQSNLVPPASPTLAAAAFANDGRSMVVNLTAPSDQGQTKIASYDTVFTCSQMLSFTGATKAKCSWISPQSLQVILFVHLLVFLCLLHDFCLTLSPCHALPLLSYLQVLFLSTAQSNANIGDAINLKSKVILPVCPTGVTCTQYSKNSSVVIQAPSRPVNPTVSLNSPAVIGACDSMIIDPTGSVGSGGRTWSTVKWAVTGSDSTSVSNIQSRLDAQYSTSNAMGKLVNVPNALFVPGTYNFLLVLTNFLGVTSLGSQSIEVSYDSAIPTASIQSPAVVATTRWQALSLFCQAKVPSCPGQPPAVIPLTYIWAMFNGPTLQNTILSYSKDPRMFRLPPYSLTAGTTYTLVVTVAQTGNTTVYTTDSVQVQVASAGLSAVIAGGASRSAAVSESVVIDASASYDIDYPTPSYAPLLKYAWSCIQTSPVYGAGCGGMATRVMLGGANNGTYGPGLLNFPPGERPSLLSSTHQLPCTLSLPTHFSTPLPLISLTLPFSFRHLHWRLCVRLHCGGLEEWRGLHCRVHRDVGA